MHAGCVQAAAPAFAPLLRADATGPDRGWLGGGCQTMRTAGASNPHIFATALHERKGGGALRDRGQRENRNAAAAGRCSRARSAVLSVTMCAADCAAGGSDGSGRNRSSRPPEISDAAREDCGREAPLAERNALHHARHRAPRTEDSAVASSSSDKTSCLADEASDLQIRALLMLLQEEDNAVVRRSILPIIAGKWAHVLGHDL